jgi:hypothetical protein
MSGTRFIHGWAPDVRSHAYVPQLLIRSLRLCWSRFHQLLIPALRLCWRTFRDVLTVPKLIAWTVGLAKPRAVGKAAVRPPGRSGLQFLLLVRRLAKLAAPLLKAQQPAHQPVHLICAQADLGASIVQSSAPGLPRLDQLLKSCNPGFPVSLA